MYDFAANYRCPLILYRPQEATSITRRLFSAVARCFFALLVSDAVFAVSLASLGLAIQNYGFIHGFHFLHSRAAKIQRLNWFRGEMDGAVGAVDFVALFSFAVASTAGFKLGAFFTFFG
jgi:hypothetical protein